MFLNDYIKVHDIFAISSDKKVPTKAEEQQKKEEALRFVIAHGDTKEHAVKANRCWNM